MTDTTLVSREPLPWNDPDFIENPYPWYEQVRESTPVLRYNDEYVLTRYDDVSTWLRDPVMSIVGPFQGAWACLEHTVLGKDAPEHTRMRRISNQWLTPKAVRDWVAITKNVVETQLDLIGADGRIDGFMDLSVVPTHVTMCRIMQVPEGGHEEVVEAMYTWMLGQVALLTDEQEALAAGAIAWLIERGRQIIAEKRRNPGDGLADHILQAQDRGEISADEALITTMFLHGLGHMDVSYAIAAGLRLMAERPDIYALYRRSPEDRSAILNEIIRLDHPELSMVRFNTADVEVKGVVIPAGSKVRFMMGAANRDPRVFENPDEFDHRRPPEASRNLAFGTGPHGCAAQVLARAEALAVFDAVAVRFEHMELAGPIVSRHNDFCRFYQEIPLRLS